MIGKPWGWEPVPPGPVRLVMGVPENRNFLPEIIMGCFILDIMVKSGRILMCSLTKEVGVRKLEGEPMRGLACRVPQSVYERICVLAKRDMRSKSGWLGWYLVESVPKIAEKKS